jgi:hypothetical protein
MGINKILIDEAYESLKSKFTNGNEIDVEKATILRTEWDALKPLIEEYLERINLNVYN